MAGTVAAGAALAIPWYFDTRTAFAFYQSQGLRLFAHPLRGVGPGGIPVVAPDAFPAPITGVTHYSINIAQFTDQLHPHLGPTTLWGYNPVVPLGGGTQSQKHLGGIFVVQRGTPIQVTFTNTLPPKHILPVDTSANFPEARKHQNAATAHVHGGYNTWISDGGPFTWFTPDGQYGQSVHSSAGNIYKLLNPGLKPGQGEYYYPNNQSARLAWYHDHAVDLTRLNAYAGIASAYIIRDSFEANLRNLGLPDFVENGGREIPIVIQDKIFVGPNIEDQRSYLARPQLGWAACGTRTNTRRIAGSWDPIHWACLPTPRLSLRCSATQCSPTALYFPKRLSKHGAIAYEFSTRCQARFLNLQLYVDDGSPDGITLDSDGEAHQRARS